MNPKRLEEYCSLGETADKHLRAGRVRDALKTYNEMLKKLEESGEMDSYLMAKITLGTLRCYVKLGDFKNAFTVWNASLEDGLHGIGIYALESAQTTVHDMITYDMLCAFLHTLADANKEEAAEAVNQYLSRVCEHALDEGDRATMRQAVNNWKQHLREVFAGSIPHQHAVALIKFERQLQADIKNDPIDFPLPSPWEKPSDFREMSRVVALKASPHAELSEEKQKSSKRRRVG